MSGIAGERLPGGDCDAEQGDSACSKERRGQDFQQGAGAHTRRGQEANCHSAHKRTGHNQIQTCGSGWSQNASIVCVMQLVQASQASEGVCGGKGQALSARFDLHM